MATTITEKDPEVVETTSGESLVVSEQKTDLVESRRDVPVQVDVDSLSIIEEEPTLGFVIEEDNQPVSIVNDPEQIIVQTVGAQGPPGPPGPAEEDVALARRTNFTNNDTIIYKGYASPGALDNQPVWRISRTTFIGTEGDFIVEWASGNSNNDKIWDDHLSLSYF